MRYFFFLNPKKKLNMYNENLFEMSFTYETMKYLYVNIDCYYNL